MSDGDIECLNLIECIVRDRNRQVTEMATTVVVVIVVIIVTAIVIIMTVILTYMTGIIVIIMTITGNLSHAKHRCET